MSKIRVLIVDDSVVMRRLIASVLEGHPRIEVAGVAANGKIGLAKMRQSPPDLVTLDIEMPEMDGLQMLTESRRLFPHIPVIMFSTLTQLGAVQTIEALTRGAADYVTKPANVGSFQESVERLRSELIPRILACAAVPFGDSYIELPPTTPSLKPGAALPAALFERQRRPGARPEVVAVASSTGGPSALETLFRGLPRDFAQPILVVQHMPPVFTALLARRLDESCALHVVEAAEGQQIESGCIYLAPGGKHLEARAARSGMVTHLHEGPLENSCRPAADVLFRSVARVWGANSLAVVLTGMGRDGSRGAAAIRECGGEVIAQNRESSVVWGMPGSVVEANLANEVAPLPSIADAILTRCGKGGAHAVIH